MGEGKGRLDRREGCMVMVYVIESGTLGYTSKFGRHTVQQRQALLN